MQCDEGAHSFATRPVIPSTDVIGAIESRQGGKPIASQTETKILTVEQFAQRLHVSRATVFVWMQREILKNGCDYFKIGRVLRFIWSEDVVKKLLEGSSDGFAEKKQNIVPEKPLSTAIHRKKTKKINFDY